jgi:hypothetical protein
MNLPDVHRNWSPTISKAAEPNQQSHAISRHVSPHGFLCLLVPFYRRGVVAGVADLEIK